MRYCILAKLATNDTAGNEDWRELSDFQQPKLSLRFASQEEAQKWLDVRYPHKDAQGRNIRCSVFHGLQPMMVAGVKEES